jgi:hypothetical protein
MQQRPRSPRPGTLWFASLAQVWLLLEWLLTVSALLPVWSFLPTQWTVTAVVSGVWLCATTLLLIPLLRGRRWAWAAFVAIFSTRVAGQAMSIVATIRVVYFWGSVVWSSVVWRSLLTQSFTLILSLCAAFLIFQTADWFGVEPRRAWRTTFREGWWAWVLCGIFGVIFPLAAQLLRGRP